MSPISRYLSGRLPTRALLASIVGLAVLLSAIFTWSALRTSAATLNTTYQAESARLTGGAATAADHSGYTGNGFVAGYTDNHKGNATTTFSVTVPTAGEYVSALRYSNGTTAPMTLSVSVDWHSPLQLTLPPTADWNSWSTIPTPANLSPGVHTIAYSFGSSDSGNVNLDKITLTTAPRVPEGRYEAEYATLSGGATVASDHSGYTGSGFVAGYTDSHKATAATTFTVRIAKAGTVPVSLRYANGTTATMTLSVYVGSHRQAQLSLPPTAGWDDWNTKSTDMPMAAGNNSVSYRFDATDSGNVNLDSITVGAAVGGGSPPPSAPPTPSPVNSSGGADGGDAGSSGSTVYQAATAFRTGGPTVDTSLPGHSGSGYLTGFTAQGAETVIDVDVAKGGAHHLAVRYSNSSGSPQTLSLYANGLKVRQMALAPGTGWSQAHLTVQLRPGLNLIGLQHDAGDTGNVAIDSLSVNGGKALETQGASLTYTEYQAEEARTNGTVLPASTTYPSISAESVDRSAVKLKDTGQYVDFILSKPADAVVVRYSIPDTAGGTVTTAPLSLYANGVKATDLSLTNKYSWLYGAGYYDTNSPSNGPAHHFYDEVRYRNGTTWPAGTVLKLQKDAADTAASYTIDVLDAEQVAPAYTMPSGFVSAADYGVKPGSDVTAALNSALSSLSGTGKGLWLPPGTYDISGRVNLSSVALRGAGEWYTTLRSTAENGDGGLFATGGRIQIADLTISGDQTFRNNDQGAAAIEGSFASGSLIYDVWMEHTKVGLWANPGNGLLAFALRARDIFADGIHVHGGSSGTRVEQSNVRNTGDDNIALDTEGGNITGSTVSHNTVQLPVQANGIGVYGGGGNVIENNAVSDTVAFGSGITISTYFGQNFSGPTTVRDNLLVRAGSYHPNWGSDIGALWIYAADQGDITQPIDVNGNTISDSIHQAVLVSYGKRVTALSLDHDTIKGAGTYGFDLENVTGSMKVSHTSVTGTTSGAVHNAAPGFTIVRGPGNSGM
jgi:hypothetical protein